MIMAEVDLGRVLELDPEILKLMVIFPFVIVIVSLFVWWQTRKTRLKQQMVERGFTAAEIKEVMDAGKQDK